jgi:hypothetical protein
MNLNQLFVFIFLFGISYTGFSTSLADELPQPFKKVVLNLRSEKDTKYTILGNPCYQKSDITIYKPYLILETQQKNNELVSIFQIKCIGMKQTFLGFEDHEYILNQKIIANSTYNPNTKTLTIDRSSCVDQQKMQEFSTCGIFKTDSKQDDGHPLTPDITHMRQIKIQIYDGDVITRIIRNNFGYIWQLEFINSEVGNLDVLSQ